MRALLGSGSRPFVSASGLILDLRPDIGVTLTGGKISSWADQSGAGVVASQSTAGLRPVLATDATNKETAIVGDTTSHLDLAGMSVPTSATYVFVFAKTVNPQAAYMISGTALTMGILSNLTGSAIEWFNGNGSDQLTFVTTPTAGLHIYAVTQVNGGALKGYLDGVQVFTKGTAAANLQAIGSILGGPGHDTNNSDGPFARAMAWNRVLTASEFQKVHDSLKARYRIP